MYSLYFDGCSKGNPGKAGAGAVIYLDGEEMWAGIKNLGKQTNNYAEYSGLILGLKKAIDLGIKEIQVYGDSMLVIKQLRGEYKVNSPNIKYLYEQSKELSTQFETIAFSHVYRENNIRADELSNNALNI